MKIRILILLSAASCILNSYVCRADFKSDGNLIEARNSLYPALVQQLYSLRGNKLLWLQQDTASVLLRKTLVRLISAADSLGLQPSCYHYTQLLAIEPQKLTGGDAFKADAAFTDAAIAFAKDIYQGNSPGRLCSFDGVSRRYALSDDAYIVKRLAAVSAQKDLEELIASLEPPSTSYAVLKSALRSSLADSLKPHAAELGAALAYYRWMAHFGFASYVVINIPSATLEVYAGNRVILKMKTVVGRADWQTPRFAAFITDVTLYPYWNIPKTILVNEWLPVFKRNPMLLKFMAMEILDSKGKVVAPSSIDWKRVQPSTFPYRIREKTGCFNPMGVVKFTLTSPYDVYLHDTNFKGSFLSDTRFYSHGCIRLENPVGLADAVLTTKVDTAFLNACRNNQEPEIHHIDNPMPVFVVYMTAMPDDSGGVIYFKDIYRLLK